MLIFCLLLFSEIDLSEVGGRDLMSAANQYRNTYLLYRVGPKTFDLYVYNWDRKACTMVSKDGRVDPAIFAYLVPHQAGIAVVCMARQRVFLLGKYGDFQDVINLRDYLEDGERPSFAAPGPSGQFFLTTRLDDHDFYNLFDLNTRKRETLYRVPVKGNHYILPNQGKHLVIKFGNGQIMALDNTFQLIAEYPALFERVGMGKALLGEVSQFLHDPFIVDKVLTLSYGAKGRNGRIDATARFSGKQLMFSAYRVLGSSPDGSHKWFMTTRPTK